MQVMSLTSSIYDFFYHLTIKCDPDLQPTDLRIFFTKNPNRKKNIFFLGGGGGVGRGEGGGGRG